MGLFQKNKQASYVDLHNNAVLRFRRASRIFIWAGVVNFVGLIISILQHYTTEGASEDPIRFWFCFGINDFLFTWFETFGLHIALFWVIVGIIIVATTAGATLLGLFASQGKKNLLIAMASIYGADWVFIFLKYFLFPERDGYLGLLINAGIHLIISFFIIMAIYQYYNVINIEKRFKDVPTVAEVKEKEQQEKQESEEKDNEHKS